MTRTRRGDNQGIGRQYRVGFLVFTTEDTEDTGRISTTEDAEVIKALPRQPSREHQDQRAYYDPIDRKGNEAMLPHPGHEPGYRPVGDDERDDEANRQQDPAVRINLRNADRVLAFSA